MASNTRRIKDLKTKMANLELEIRALLEAGKTEPGIIDAVAADISDFTDEIMKIKKQLKEKNLDESIKLTDLYEELKKQNR